MFRLTVCLFVLQANGITYVLNVSMTCPKPAHIQEGHFLRIPVNDNYSEKLLPYFHEAFQFIGRFTSVSFLIYFRLHYEILFRIFACCRSVTVSVFTSSLYAVDKVREANGCVLVHCLAGISRSPTLAIAYIMRSYNMVSEDAYR